MTAFILKQYQQDALVALDTFLQGCVSTRKAALPLNDTHLADMFSTALGEAASGVREARAVYQPVFNGVPSVCLRVPTGGGKTLLAAHAVALAGKDRVAK